MSSLGSSRAQGVQGRVLEVALKDYCFCVESLGSSGSLGRFKFQSDCTLHGPTQEFRMVVHLGHHFGIIMESLLSYNLAICLMGFEDYQGKYWTAYRLSWALLVTERVDIFVWISLFVRWLRAWISTLDGINL